MPATATKNELNPESILKSSDAALTIEPRRQDHDRAGSCCGVESLDRNLFRPLKAFECFVSG